MRFMMPKTSVSPADIKKSMTPSWTPLRSCSTKSAGLTAALRLARHRAFLGVGVGVVAHDDLLELHHVATLGVLADARQVVVLDGEVVSVEAEVAAHRIELHRLHGLAEGVLVLDLAA